MVDPAEVIVDVLPEVVLPIVVEVTGVVVAWARATGIPAIRAVAKTDTFMIAALVILRSLQFKISEFPSWNLRQENCGEKAEGDRRVDGTKKPLQAGGPAMCYPKWRPWEGGQIRWSRRVLGAMYGKLCPVCYEISEYASRSPTEPADRVSP